MRMRVMLSLASIRIIKKGISRGGLLKEVGSIVAVIGLSQSSIGLIGCDSIPHLFLYGQEMVGKVTSTTATVRLVAGDQCTSSTKFRLRYDTVSRNNPMNYLYQTSEVSGFSLHDPITFDLDSLSPNTQYYYRVEYDTGQGWIYRDEYSFHTQRPPGESFRFCIATDLHVYPYGLHIGKALRERAYKNILADAPDILIALGDDYFVAFQSKQPYPWQGQKTLWDTWQRTREIFDVAAHSMFCLFVNGNHEGLYGWTTLLDMYRIIGEGTLRYLPVPDSGTFPEGGDSHGRYGAFTWGDVLIIWLDVVGFCEVDPHLVSDNALYILGNDQRTFLENTLMHSSATWKLIFAHHLFGGDDDMGRGYGRGNANDALNPLYEQFAIQNMMELYGAQAFFYGHDHVFSVSKANGISYICAGHSGSGCPWVAAALQYYAPYDIFVTDSEGKVPAGHVRVDVDTVHTLVTVSYIKASSGPDNGTVLANYIINP